MGNGLAQQECWPIKPKRGKDVENGTSKSISPKAYG